MAKSNKPIFWGLFAAGGTVTAFRDSVLVLITLFAAMRFSPALFTYEYLHAFAAAWLGVWSSSASSCCRCGTPPTGCGSPFTTSASAPTRWSPMSSMGWRVWHAADDHLSAAHLTG